MTPAAIQLILFFVFLFFSAFFSASETAVLSFPRLRLQRLVDKNNIRAKTLKKLLKRPRELISTILIGNNIVNSAAASIATIFLSDFFLDFNLPKSMLVLSATITTTVFLLVFSEITPKSFAIQRPEIVALNSVFFLRFLRFIFFPLVFVLSLLAMLVDWLFSAKQKDRGMTLDDVRALSSLLKENKIFEAKHLEMISNIVEFSTRQIDQIMTHRSDIVFLHYDMSYAEVKSVVEQNGYTRYPVYKVHRDNILGIFNAFTLLRYENDKSADFKLAKLVSPALFVSEFSTLLTVLQQMQDKQNPLALVVDEYGSVKGLATIEDILEEIVGDIFDETEKPAEKIYFSDRSHNKFIVQGNITFAELREATGVKIDKGDLQIDTLAGLLLHHLGRKPKTGDEIKLQGLALRIAQMSRNRIKKILVEKVEPSSDVDTLDKKQSE